MPSRRSFRLNAEDSTLPATVMQYTVKNVSGKPLQGVLAGWLQNAVCLESGGSQQGDLVNTKQSSDNATTIVCSARASDRPVEERPVIVLADFENNSYGDWSAEGQALGTAPAPGTLPNQNPVDGFQGKGLVNTYLGGDHAAWANSPRRRLKSIGTSSSFLVGGGNHAGRTCINLLVDGQIVRTATGKAAEHLAWHNWNVRELAGKQATHRNRRCGIGPVGAHQHRSDRVDRPGSHGARVARSKNSPISGR